MLPVDEIVPPVFRLPPVMLPVTDTMVPVRLAALTMVVNTPLPP